MKIKILIILLLSGLFARSQVEVTRSPAAVQVDDIRLRGILNLVIPVYADTATANTNKGKDYIGALIQIISTGQVYHRDTTAGGHKWTAMASGVPSVAWGAITGGNPMIQTDLATILNGKQNLLTVGSSLQYIRGDLSLGTFPTNVSTFTNDANYLTAINTQFSLTGAGTVASKLQLVNDAATPGATKFYGTDGGGTKGWYTFPAPGTGSVTSIATQAPITGGTITTTGTIGIDTSAGIGKVATKSDLTKYWPVVNVHGAAPRMLYYDANGVISYTNFIYDSTNTRLNMNGWSSYSNDGSVYSYTLFPGTLTFLKTGCANCSIQLNSGVGVHVNIGSLATDIGGDVNSFATGVGAPGAAGMAKIYIGKNTQTTPGTGSLKLGDGLLVTTPESGLMEYRNGWFMITDSDIVAHTNSRDTIATRSFARAFGGGGGGVATIPPNIGTGFRVYAPQTPGFKTLTAFNGVLIDSTTSTLFFQVDSSRYVTQYQFNNSTATINLRTPGTGAGQFHLAYVNTSNLVIPDLVAGYGLQHSQAMDSLQTIYADTASAHGLVSKDLLAAAVFASGSTNLPGGIDGDIQRKSGTSFVGGGATWDAINKIENINFSQNNEEGYFVSNPNAGINGAGALGASNGTQTTKITQHGSGNTYSILPVSAGGLYSNAPVLSIYNDNANADLRFGAGANIASPLMRLTPWKLKINPAILQNGSTIDSILVINTSDSSVYALSQASISNKLTRQSITSGTSGTVIAGNYVVKFDFASVAATYTLTLPSAPGDQDIIDIQTGTTIAAPGAEITSLTVVANTGQTLNVYSTLSAVTFYSGTHIKLRYNTTGAYWDRLD